MFHLGAYMNEMQTSILQMIVKEKKSGCLNSSVFGGFDDYVFVWAKKNNQAELALHAQAYKGASLTQREELLAQMEQMITQNSGKEERKQKSANAATLTVVATPSAMQAKGRPSSSLDTPIQYMKHIGPKKAALFQRLGIHTVGDLLFYLPRDYQDRRHVMPVIDAPVGETVVLKGKIIDVGVIHPKSRLVVIKALIQDESGIFQAVWFNQSYLLKQLTVGRTLLLQGKLERKFNQLQMSVTDFEWIDDVGTWQPRIVPVYRSTENLHQKAIIQVIETAWDRYGHLIEEVLPQALLQSRVLMGRAAAVYQMHFPASFEQKEAARKRLAYEELFLLQSAIVQSGSLQKREGIAHAKESGSLERFLKILPFELTKAQLRVINEILDDMEQPYVMARLVQGDVGSGKTVVAAAAVNKAVSCGYQAALMAPTEILAQQHERTLTPLLNSLGIRTALLTGRTTAKQRQQILGGIAAHTIDFLIGTHAILEDEVTFADLSLAITDEQHRFGVLQREKLQGKAQSPDILVMTATPIPRSLALTLYGDLSLSVVDELPPNRRPIQTYAVGYDMEDRIFAFVEKEIKEGRQVFMVCPLVEESEKLDLQSAIETYEHLQKDVFSQYRVGLLHGKMKPAEKEAVMDDFVNNKIQILVATTVIEVGINIPNASIMLVRDAQRFGLAQLHQLRGRIGRGTAQSYCVLMHHAASDVARERMHIMAESCDGFVIAEADLRLRGPGEFFGTRQHGLPELKCANLFQDAKLLEETREDAISMLSGDIVITESEKAAMDKQISKYLKRIN